MGKHRRQGIAAPRGPLRFRAGRRAGVVAVMAAGVLLGSGCWQPAGAATTRCGCDIGDDEDVPAASHGSNHGLLIIDNSNADSWLEVDRTLNTLVGSKGTAGSDHDGDGGDIEAVPATPQQSATAPQASGPPRNPGWPSRPQPNG
jgi:hypothetical protein